jgi:hypothetical protein
MLPIARHPEIREVIETTADRDWPDNGGLEYVVPGMKSAEDEETALLALFAYAQALQSILHIRNQRRGRR